jgi:VanZ family protein
LSDRRGVGRWLPAGAWAAVIFTLSTGWFSAEHTGGVLLPILAALFPSWSPETLATTHALIRKAAHFTEYLILGVLLIRGYEPARADASAGTRALVLGAAFACSDEYHQTFVPSRTPAVHDVAVDVCGLATGIALAIAWRQLRRRPG